VQRASVTLRTEDEGEEGKAPSRLMPSPLPFETALVRRSIIASYWLIALLAVGVWWATTSIERLSLPESEIHELASRTVGHVEPTANPQAS
jgi:hypothetical protein